MPGVEPSDAHGVAGDPGGRSRRTPDEPARAREARTPGRSAGDEQPPLARTGLRSPTLLGWLWVLAVLVVAGALGALRSLETDAALDQSAAAVLGTLLAVGLAARSGGGVLLPALLAALVGAAAVLTQWPPLLAGVAVATGVLAGCLAVLGTVPARGPLAVVREVVLAQLVATAGALAVGGLAVDIDVDRFGYTVLGLAMAATLPLVHRLGGGLHGLGRRGLVAGLGALVLLVVALAYTAALGTYGSPELIAQVDSARGWLRDHLGAVPRPIEALVGIPALAWGVSVRDRRRQGWWVCAFGTAGTAGAASRLVDPGVSEVATALGAAYSLVVGLLLGFALIRLSGLVTRRRSRRTPEVGPEGPEEGGLHRPEPPRLRALH